MNIIKRRSGLYGKILERIEVDSEETDMFEEITFIFADGSKIKLTQECYSDSCYMTAIELKIDDEHITMK